MIRVQIKSNFRIGIIAKSPLNKIITSPSHLKRVSNLFTYQKKKKSLTYFTNSLFCSLQLLLIRNLRWVYKYEMIEWKL